MSFSGGNTKLDMDETGIYNDVVFNYKVGTGEYKDGVNIASEKSFYIVLPNGTLQGGFDVEVTVMLDNKTYTYRKGIGGAMGNSIHTGYVRRMYPLEFNVGFMAQNKLVEFASGDLYCESQEANGTTNDVWGIVEHPWAFNTVVENNQVKWNPKHVSYFYWTSECGNAADNAYKGNETETEFFFIEIKGEKWSTLSDAEWDDIISSSSRVTNYNHPWAKVLMRPTPEQPGTKAGGDMAGLLLFPAEWDSLRREGACPMVS